jgi:hypothetical protein
MLRPLQKLLETIYDAPCGHDVRDFLLTQRRQLPGVRRAAAADEELVLIEQRRCSRLGLYIDEAVLARLTAQDPLRALTGANIGDFWTAVEGVSHFSYLMWNAGHQRGVSQLELELQGEVDKYITAFWLLRAQHPGHRPRELLPALFEKTRIDPRLPPARQQLYAAATSYAARFCARLEAALLSERPIARHAAVTGLRRFYRFTCTRKLRHIEQHGGRMHDAVAA